MYHIFSLIKQLYDKWNIRILVLFSLLLQTILILFAPFRKRTRSVMVITMLWIAYLLADWTAIFAVGLISYSQKEGTQKACRHRHPDEQADILAFWASFLLLHLGGPDTITAFAIEDNGFWLRHLVGFITQVLTAILVIYQSLPVNNLWLPSVLIFVVGTIKYAERTRALFLADKNQFRKSMFKEPEPGPNYVKLMTEYSSKKLANLPVHVELVEEPEEGMTTRDVSLGQHDDLAVVKTAYDFYEIFKGLIVDRIFTSRERRDSRGFFGYRIPKDAFRVLVIELNFMYEDLYTKVRVVHSVFGYSVRFISCCAIVTALSTFYSLDKHDFHEVDIGITYCLLFGAICLDTIAIFMLAFSDWTAVSLMTPKDGTFIVSIKEYFRPVLCYFLSLKEIKLPETPQGHVTQGLFGRWSGCLHKHNLIDYCFQELSRMNPAHHALVTVTKSFGLKDWYDWITHVENIYLTENAWEFIFSEVKKKSYLADDLESAKRIRSSRGNFAIEDNISIARFKTRASLMHYIVDFDYDQTLIIWHIATELCYQTKDAEEDSYLELCKNLSDYMIYLLIMQSTLMSDMIGIGRTAFYDTCADTKRFFIETSMTSIKDACLEILGINTDVKPIHLKGNRSKSLLFDACILAKELKELKEDMWILISKVWVELLSYAATHCKAHDHAAQLSKGGELITVIWLLMAHFGIGEQFEINKGQMNKGVLAKLIMGK